MAPRRFALQGAATHGLRGTEMAKKKLPAALKKFQFGKKGSKKK
jgi:hypothetical protein